VLWGEPPEGLAAPAKASLLVPSILLAAAVVLGVALTPGVMALTAGVAR
jgi:hypothetical protein